MSEYEMATFVTMQVNMLDGVLMNFFTILTAYLVAGFAASHRLSLPVALFVTILFVVVCAYLTSRFALVGAQITNLVALEHEQLLAGKGFAWSVGAKGSPEGGLVMLYGVVSVMAVAALGSIYMFFLMRRNHQTLPAKP